MRTIMVQANDVPASVGQSVEQSLRTAVAISQVLNLSLDLDEMLQLLAQTVHSLIGFDCSVVLIDPETQVLTWAGYYGLSNEYIHAMNSQENDLRSPVRRQGTISRAYRSRRPEYISDLSDDRARPWRDAASREGIVSVISTPMIRHDEVLGFITCYTRQPHTYAPAEIDQLTIMANQAAIAIESARLHAHERRRVRELEQLNARLAEQHTLLGEQHADLVRAEQIHQQLTAVLLEDRGLDAVLGQIAGLVGRPAVLYDGTFKQIARSPVAGPLDALDDLCVAQGRMPRSVFDTQDTTRLLERLRDECRPVRFLPADLPGAAFSRYISPVSTGRSILGYLEVVESPAEVGGLALRAVEHGATVLALELLKQRAVVMAEQQLRGSFLDALLAGEFDSDEAIERRASFVGFDLSRESRVLALGCQPDRAAGEQAAPPILVDSLHRRLEDAVVSWCRVRSPSSLVTVKGNMVVLLLPETGDGALAAPDGNAPGRPPSLAPGLPETIRSLRNDVGDAMRGIGVSIGVGSVCRRASDFARSFDEARYCLDLLHRFGAHVDVLAIDTVGLHRFLLHVGHEAELLAFAHRTLDRLLAQDERNGNPLLETITTYLRLRCNVSRTAEALVLHANTVVYRLKRIEQHTGLELDAPEHLMSLQLALLVASLNPQEFPALRGHSVSELHAALAQRTGGKRRPG